MKTRDIDIRVSLHYQLRKEHMSDPDTMIVDELSLCQGDARIDVAVVNGSINGYEIKSESDTLERLPKQCEFYNKIFDTVTVLTASKFIDGITDIIPDWWGITIAEKDHNGVVCLSSIRPAKKNSEVDPYSLAQLLWREEAICILKEKGLQRGLLSKPRQQLWLALSEKLPLEELQEAVRTKIKARKNWKLH